MRSESGQSTVEFAGTIVWLLLAGLFALQLVLVGWTAVSAGNAARTAARLVSRNVSQADARQAAQEGLADRGLSDATVSFPASGQGDRATVYVKIPPVFPLITRVLPNFGITESAEMPPTG
jgi:Flp pilus assembly protein TadG